jgi:hypothetical protein
MILQEVMAVLANTERTHRYMVLLLITDHTLGATLAHRERMFVTCHLVQGINLLRRVLVNREYDTRYTSRMAKQRIAGLFIPFFISVRQPPA